MSRGPVDIGLEYARALTVLGRRQAVDEWRGASVRRWLQDRTRPRRAVASPRDLRPIELETGRAILAGRFVLAGAVLEVGLGGDPWDTPSPTRRFAVELHRFSWLPSLLATGEVGEREALRLTLEWERLFGRFTAFAWSAEVAERRVHAWSCGLRRLLERGADQENSRLLSSLARQAADLLTLDDGPIRAAERAVVAATAASALAPPVGTPLLERALARVPGLLDAAVLADGGCRSRSPQQGLELLFDLLTLDDALVQRGRSAPIELSRALDRLTAATRFFTLGDGRLAAFQGGEAVEAGRVDAARALEDAPGPPFAYAPHTGYHRLSGRTLQVIADAGAPAQGGWAAAACAQPLSLEVSGGRDKLIVNAGWSPDAAGPAALRLGAAGSTLTLEERSPGKPLRGVRAEALGARLVGGAGQVEARRNEDPSGDVWIELSHDGWLARTGYRHERRLYLAADGDELRGEDRLVAAAGSRARPMPYAVRFHLHPDVKASATRDGSGVLLRAAGGGWRLKSDAAAVTLEPSACFTEGQPRRTEQVVMRGQARTADGARVRWKLEPVTG